MTADEEIRDHQARCLPYVLQLRMLARDDHGLAPAAAEVAQATAAIIAEVGAGSRAVSTASGYRQVQPGAGTFLQVRLDRLAAAADEAIAAARDGNVPMLSRVLNRFEALITAIWMVQPTVYAPPPGDDHQAARGPSPLDTTARRADAGR
jgi:hypothetical protein